MTESNGKERAISLILKLKEIRLDRGATPAEEARALSKIQQLLEMHQLSMFDVKSKVFNDDLIEEKVAISGQILHAWYGTLASCLASAFDCRVVQIPKGKWGSGSKQWEMSFLGYVSDVKIVVYFFNYLKVRLNEMADADGRKAGRRGSQLFAFRKHYIRAAAIEIGRRLKEERDARLQKNVTSRALVVVKAPAVKEFLSKVYPRLVKGASAEWKDREAYAAGLAAGQRVELKHGVETDGGSTTYLE